MAGPATVVVAGIVTAWIAAKNADELVADDYYKRGKAVNMDLKRDNAASAMHLSADVFLGDDHRNLRVQLKADSGFKSPAQLRLRLIHPTKIELDQETILQKSGGDFYEGILPSAVDGRRHISVEDMDNQWRLTNTWRIEQESAILLKAAKNQTASNANR
jgi:hypothetical protein